MGLVAAVAAALAPHARAQDSSGVRQEFMSAYSTARSGAPAVKPDSRALTEYVLFPYLEAARLRRDLSANGAIEAFIETHGATPVGRALRRDWLLALAERRDWTRFLDHYDPELDDGETLRCHALTARVALGRTGGLENDALGVWSRASSAPEACDPAFDWLRNRGALTADRFEQRARLALAAGESSLARFLVRSLSADRARPLLLWADLIDRPAAAIDQLIAMAARPVEEAALRDGWSRLARRDPDGAIQRFPRLIEARGLDEAAASPHALALGVGLALSRRPGALAYFAQARPQDFDERSWEWQVRAALWAGDWSRVAAGIAAMPSELATQNRWRYWLGRAAEHGGHPAAAREYYALVVPTDNWYAVLAAARLGQKFSPNLQPIDFDADAVARLARTPSMQRVRELLACNLESEATVEWRAAYDVLTPAEQRAAVRLAADFEWPLQSIATAAKQSLFNDYPLLYPQPYDSAVRSAARLTGLREAQIYAIMRQESLYRADAASTAGALGLMQLLPSTAQRAARRWDLKPPSRSELLVPSINVPIGAGELRNLIDRFSGQLAPAYAAYNAGPGAARRWLPPEPLDVDIWVENIPYNETRAYVQRVAWHNLVFTWLGDRKPIDASAWLTQIGPLETVAAD
jgi:soluble lytic murein transglycosylase